MRRAEALWFAHQRKRFMRPDAHRFFRNRFQADAGNVADETLATKASRRVVQPAPLEVDPLDAVISILRSQRQITNLRALIRKANFNPDQPRDEDGRWSGNGEGGLPDIPTGAPGTAKLRNAIIKQTAKWLAKAALIETSAGPIVGTLLNVAEAALWVYEYAPYLQSYLDEPKTLEELQQDSLDPQKGYDIHHIVEQTPAELDGFPRSLIDSDENRVRVPTLKHWQITGWYMMKDERWGGMSPREYLRGKGWEERQRIGYQALIRYGVLKP